MEIHGKVQHSQDYSLPSLPSALHGKVLHSQDSSLPSLPSALCA